MNVTRKKKLRQGKKKRLKKKKAIAKREVMKISDSFNRRKITTIEAGNRWEKTMKITETAKEKII